MSRKLLRLLRAGHQQLQADPQQQLIGLQQHVSFGFLQSTNAQLRLIERHLWAQQHPWQLQQHCSVHSSVQQQQHLLQASNTSSSNGSSSACKLKHAFITSPRQQYVSAYRAYAAAADPARAIAETMAEVAQRKLADVQRQHEALTAKMEGV